MGADGTLFVASADGLFVGRVTGAGAAAFTVWESTDGGARFAALGGLPAGFVPTVGTLRVTDGAHILYLPGRVDDAAGGASPRIAGDARRVFLVVSGPREDRLFESTAAGGAPVERLRLPAYLSSFAFGAPPTRTVFVGSKEGTLFRSADAGQTFSRIDGAPRFRCLAVHGAALLACADWANDGFALGRSSDGGATWAGIFRFEDAPENPAVCLRSRCSTDWLCGFVCGGGGGGADAGLPWPPARDGEPPETIDASDAAVDAIAAIDADADGPGSTARPGCRCGASKNATTTDGAVGALVAAGALIRRRRLRGGPPPERSR